MSTEGEAMLDCGRYWYFPAPGRGGLGMRPEKTAVLFIEFQVDSQLLPWVVAANCRLM